MPIHNRDYIVYSNTVVDIAKETRIDVLRQIALLLERENRRLHDKLAATLKEINALKGGDSKQLQLELTQLQHQLQQLNRRIYGGSSEKKSGQKPRTGKSSKQEGHGPSPQLKLETAEQQHELDEADKACPECLHDLVEWNGQCEESEEIQVVERRFVVVTHKRKKYRCRCGHIETAIGPSKLIPGGRYSPSFAIEVAIAKYLDHLPLARQVRMMRRAGLKVTTQTLWDQLYALYKFFAPLGPRLHEYILSKECIGADETTWRMLDKKDKGRKNWYAWAVCADDAVFYRICDSRSAASAKAILDGYQGTVMTDDYSAYGALMKDCTCTANFIHAGCWAHARRKFIEAETNEPIRAPAVVALISKLYEYEKLATAPPGEVEAQRKDIRNTKSRSVVAALKAWTMEKSVLPKSSFGKALAYLRKNFSKLERFLDDPAIPLDNNSTERAMRGIVIGRKNHYGSKSKRGTEVAALLYSLLESAKLAGVEPKAYLKAAIAAAIAGNPIPLPHELETV